MREEDQKTICLYGLRQLAIILEQPTGVWYYNQTGGISCNQSYQEGILAILGNDIGDLDTAIAQYTLNMFDLDEKDADHIDSLFEHSTQYLKVNREKLKESNEAWIYVTVDGNHNLSPFSGFDCKYGVLTWNNSD